MDRWVFRSVGRSIGRSVGRSVGRSMCAAHVCMFLLFVSSASCMVFRSRIRSNTDRRQSAKDACVCFLKTQPYVENCEKGIDYEKEIVDRMEAE